MLGSKVRAITQGYSVILGRLMISVIGEGSRGATLWEMKIVNLDTFIALPSGTLFAKYEPCVFGPLSVKHESLPESKDFFCQDLIEVETLIVDGKVYSFSEDILESAEHHGTSFTLDYELIGRDAMYEPTQLFAVFEPDDVVKFKAFINSLP